MNLKAKLCIMKNYTLLLLGPSSFEQWCESCPCFIVRPLSFLLFAIRSPVFLLESPSSPVLLPHARAFCRRPPPSACSSASLVHASSCHPFHRPCPFRCPPLAVPRWAAGAEQLPRTKAHRRRPPSVTSQKLTHKLHAKIFAFENRFVETLTPWEPRPTPEFNHDHVTFFSSRSARTQRTRG
jgi:hypothetical protein